MMTKEIDLYKYKMNESEYIAPEECSSKEREDRATEGGLMAMRTIIENICGPMTPAQIIIFAEMSKVYKQEIKEFGTATFRINDVINARSIKQCQCGEFFKGSGDKCSYCLITEQMRSHPFIHQDEVRFLESHPRINSFWTWVRNKLQKDTSNESIWRDSR